MNHLRPLNPEGNKIYLEKIKSINNNDPYEIELQDELYDEELLPDITYPDIFNYLVEKKTSYTFHELKKYKDLDAYNLFVDGWVRDVRCKIINQKHVVLAKVMHTQIHNIAPLQPWVIAEKDGRVDNGHCNCTAGLGETCTHICALLFYVEAAVILRNQRCPKENSAYWKLPQSSKRGEYKLVKDIDFSSAKKRKRDLDASGGTNLSKKTVSIKKPDEKEIAEFLKNLFESKTNAAILTVSKEYSKYFIPKSVSKDNSDSLEN